MFDDNYEPVHCTFIRSILVSEKLLTANNFQIY